MPDPNLISLHDRIKELSYTIGTGNFLLIGPPAGFSAFSSAYENNSNVFYAATDGTRYEVGSGVYMSDSSNFLIRFPLKSTNNNQLVNFPEGIKEVYVTYPATHAVINASGINGNLAPAVSGIAFWSDSNIINGNSNIVWDATNNMLGINKAIPQCGIDVGGSDNQGLVRASGFVVGTQGIFFPPENNGDSSYTGGVQLSHYEPNQLDNYAVDNDLIDSSTGTSAVLQLSGVANNIILFQKQQANLFFAGPSGSCSPPCSPNYPSFRIITAEDLPDLSDTYAAASQINDVSGILNTKIINYYGLSTLYTASVSGILNNKTNAAYINNGRLGLENGVSVSFDDQVGKSIIYFNPHDGNLISLYNGSSWNTISFNTVSLTLSGLVTGALYDIFAYDNNGSLALELSNAWTNATSRNTPLVFQNGVLCKNGNLTRRYLGTFKADSVNSVTDSRAKRHVWNMRNRILRPLYNDLLSSWTYGGAYRRLNSSTTFEIGIVNGYIQDNIVLNASVNCGGSTSIVYSLSMNKKGLTTAGTYAVPYTLSTSTGGGSRTISTSLNDVVELGFTNFYPVENGSVGTASLSAAYITGNWNC